MLQYLLSKYVKHFTMKSFKVMLNIIPFQDSFIGKYCLSLLLFI